MKKTIFRFGFTAFAAVMVLITAACSGGGGGEGGGNIAANVRAYNNNGSAPAQSPAMPNAHKAPRAVHASFDQYTDFYTKLGAHKADFTPSKFCLTTMINGIDSEGNLMNLGMENFDFAEGVTLTIGEIPVGITCAAITFWFTTYTNSGERVPSTLEFKWPGGKSAFDSHTQKNHYTSSIFGVSESWNADNVTLSFDTFLPYHVQSAFTLSSNVTNFTGIAYGAGERRVLSGDITFGDLIAGGGANPSGVVVDNGSDAIIVPFTPIAIPAGAGSVTLHISWNLDDIISQYEGVNSADDDDIFVLKENWWDGLYLYASVQ